MQILLKVILAPFFFLVVAPLAMLMRLLGVDLIDKNIDKNQTTYWQPGKPEHPPTASDKSE